MSSLGTSEHRRSLRHHFPQLRADGRWLTAAILVAFAVLLTCLIGRLGPSNGWSFAGVLYMGAPYADLYIFPAARLEIKRGGNPFVANPADPWRRPYNYPRVWLSLMRYPLEWVPAVGAGLTLTWLAGLAVWWGRLTWRQGILAGVFLCSPPVVLALERGNSDLIVFLALLTALGLSQRGWWPGTWTVLSGAFAMKLYPAAAFSVFLRLGWKRAWPWLAAACLLGGYIVGNLDELGAISRNTTTNVLMTYGSPVWLLSVHEFQKLMGGTGLAQTQFQRYASSSMAGAFLLAGGCFLAGWRMRPAEGAAEPARSIDGFRAGSCIYLATFVISSSYVYRLIFLLLCLPMLWRQPENEGDGLRRAKLAALVLAVGLVWATPFWWFPLAFGRELCAWGLVGVFGWLLGATLIQPDISKAKTSVQSGPRGRQATSPLGVKPPKRSSPDRTRRQTGG